MLSGFREEKGKGSAGQVWGRGVLPLPTILKIQLIPGRGAQDTMTRETDDSGAAVPETAEIRPDWSPVDGIYAIDATRQLLMVAVW